MKWSKTISIPGQPCAKPRMTRRDKWQRRSCVMAYRTWADQARAAFGTPKKIMLTAPTFLYVTAWFARPQSNTSMDHTVKPDADNVLKAVCDALFENDQYIVCAQVQKYWAAHEGPRTVVTVEYST